MVIQKLFAHKGGPVTAILIPIQVKHFVSELLRETSIRCLAAGSMNDPVVSLLPHPLNHSPKLSAAQSYKLRCLFLSDPLIQCLMDNVQPFGFSPAHCDHVLVRH